MTVRITAAGAIALEGDCPSEDAEALLRELLAIPEAMVDWRACEGVHTAVVQVLLATRARLIGPPANAALRDWLQPILTDPRPE